jgi:hypothetical protein
MKRVLLFSIVCIILIGCSTEDSTFYKYDNNSLQKKLHKMELDYAIKTPSIMPFKVEKEHIETKGRLITITFLGENEEKLDLKIVKQPNVNYAEDQDREEVMVGDEKGVYFIPTGRKSIMILNWNIGPVAYDMGYYNLLSKKEITKEEFIKIAESFED